VGFYNFYSDEDRECPKQPASFEGMCFFIYVI